MRDNISTLEENDLYIYFDGLEVLKGVLRDRPYPLCWVNMNRKLTNIELRLNGKIKQSMQDILKYLRYYIEDSKNQLHYPYITNAPKKELFGGKWSGYDNELRKIKKMNNRVTNR
jgi:hypothetical protein